jgi:sugar O-acyltransferase (sialic acid O-acetyltransferase NeuD family)
MKEIILIGGGGHCRSCIDVIETEGKFQIAGILDVAEKKGQKISGYEIIGTDHDIEALAQKYDYFFISLGQIKSYSLRDNLFKRLRSLGVKTPTITSPYAITSRYATTGEGSIIMHGAIINSHATIGHNSIINTSALIEHDASVGDCTHISTAAIINGSSRVGNHSFIGSNTVIKDSIKIGDRCIISAGTFIKNDLPDDSLVKT